MNYKLTFQMHMPTNDYLCLEEVLYGDKELKQCWMLFLHSGKEIFPWENKFIVVRNWHIVRLTDSK